MQAIILAAGMGKRLGALTQNNTKCMVKVNGVPLIERMLNQLENLSTPLSRIVLVVGYEAESLKEFIATLDIKTPIEYVENPIYATTNNIYSLSLAKAQLMEDDTLLFESDLIFDTEVVEKLVTDPYPSLALVAKFESWMDGTVVTLDDEDNIKKFIPGSKFLYEESKDYFKTVNIYKFSKAFSCSHYVPFLSAYSHALGNNEYYEQVLRVISLLDKPEIKALRLTGEAWYEIDDVQDLDIASSIFAPDAEEQLSLFNSRFGGYWRYPHYKDFCYLVNPYFPNARLISEMKANFATLCMEYPSGMSVNSLLAGKYFHISSKHICVGNGAAELIKAFVEHLEGKVGVIYPTFEEYPNRLDPSRLVTMQASAKDFSYTADDLMEFFGDKDIATLIVVNPDNPSGNFITKEGLLRLCSWSKQKGIRLLIDESFIDFSADGSANSMIHDDILESNPHLVVMKSISKSYGVPGLRLGVLCSADLEMIARMKKDVAIWNINSFAEFYMQIFGKYEGAYELACATFRAERDRFRSQLETVPFLRVYPSQANYFMCEVLPPYTSRGLACAMLKKALLIKDCSTKKGFDGRQFIRLAVRDTADNDLLVKKLKSL